jgi:amino acid adenylation domain-containing protein
MTYSNYLKKLEIAANQRVKERAYWLDKLSGEIVKSIFPYDDVQRKNESISREITFGFFRELFSKLMALSGGSDLKTYMILATCLAALLHRYSDRRDIIIGTPIFTQGGNGNLINQVLLLRNHIWGNMTFRELLRQVKQSIVETIENQNYPVEILPKQLNLATSPGDDFPLFDVSILFQSIHNQEFLLHVKHNMCFSFHVTGKTIGGTVKYNASLYHETTIERIVRHFKQLLAGALADVDSKISHIDILTDDEKRQILLDFNDTKVTYPKKKTVHELFEEQVLRTPYNIAWIGPVHPGAEPGCHQHLTYSRLNVEANRLARMLRKRRISPNTIVSIMVEPSPDMIIGILAILKSSGAYLPVDPVYPESRRSYLLRDSGTEFLLTRSDLWTGCEFDGEIIDINNPGISKEDNENLESLNTLDSLAYIIYTSGSTGKPKGVIVEHQNLLAYVSAFLKEFEISLNDTIIQQASFTFDAFVEEVYPALLKGGRIAIPSFDEILNMSLLQQFIDRHKVTLISCSPLLLNQLSRAGTIKSIHTFISGGDVLKREYVENLLRFGTAKVYNTYGPTEATVCVTYYRCLPNSPQSIPLGKPISNYNVYILDKENNLQPVGVPGEICIAGDGVTLGYLNRPQLTWEKFTANPFAPGESMYRTGDLGRWMPGGNVQFLGRIDHQVKIRGYRIELGEIENQLLKHGKIKETFVLAKEDQRGDKCLCAYIVPRSIKTFGSVPSITKELREYLADNVPGYMIPSYFVQLRNIPLTPNGKVDRRALPDPVVKSEASYIAPRNRIEQSLVHIWSGILKIEKEIIGIDDNFFELGGHSLKTTTLAAEIYKWFNVRVPLGEIFKAHTIRLLAGYIRNSKGTITSPSISLRDDNLVLLRETSDKASHLFFIHDGSGEVEGYVEFCRHLDVDMNCWGIRADIVRCYAPQNLTIEEIAGAYIHKIIKVQSHGPYFIAGWSIGGTIAFEIGRQLEELKEEIGFLALIDSAAPHEALRHLAKPFDLKSELNLVQNHFPEIPIKQKTKETAEINRLWQLIADYLEESNFEVEIVRKLVPEGMSQAIPNFNQLCIRELIYYLNMIRTLDNARAFYIPSKKINTTLHSFEASASDKIIKEQWSQYCSKPVKAYEIRGNHYSILKMPQVIPFVEIFSKVISGLTGILFFDFEMCRIDGKPT